MSVVCQGALEEGGAPSNLVGPSWLHRPTFFPLYIPTYPGNISGHHENLIPPPQPSVYTRSHLEACSGAPPKGASTTEGFYIITIAPPMKCE